MSVKKILLIDDCSDFKSGLERLLKSMGHSTNSCSDLERAKEYISNKDYDYIFIDCLMPVNDGFTVSKVLSKILKLKSAINTKMIMISGLITDSKTQTEALSKDSIFDFISKPISKNDLENCLGPSINKSSFLNSLSKIQNAKDLETFLAKKTNITGLELTSLTTALSKFEVSCKLEISDTASEKLFTLEMAAGALERITSSEYSNSLGELLVGLNYLSREDLSSYVNSAYFNDSKDPIGKALVKLNLLSPHAVPIALRKQLQTRLSELFIIQNSNFKFKILPAKVSDGFCSLSLYDLRIESSNFFKSEHSSHFLSEISSYIYSTKLKASPTEQNAANIKIPNLDSNQYSDNELKIIMSCIALDQITTYPDEVNGKIDGSSRQDILEIILNIQKKLKTKNPYKVLSIASQGATDQKVSKAYQDIAKILHPDKINNTLEKNNLSQAEDTFRQVTEYFNLIKTIDNRKTYESVLKNRSTQEKMHSHNNLEVSKLLLNRGEYGKAFNSLNTKSMYGNAPNEFGLYLLWSALKSKNTEKMRKPILQIFDEESRDLTNEPLYYYLKSLYSLKNGDNKEFKKHIDQSLKANPHFLPARREAQIVKSKLLQQKKATHKSSWFGFKKSS